MKDIPRGSGSKDPLPNANNSFRVPPAGNSPADEEGHGQKKAERIAPDQRYTLRKGEETQPVRESGDGNTPVSGEMHNSPKAEFVPEGHRF